MGDAWCRYLPRGGWRPVSNFLADGGAEKLVYLVVEVFPSLCSLDTVEAAALDAFRYELSSLHPTQEFSSERRGSNVLLARAPSTRMAFVTTADELFYMEMNVPRGPSADDDADLAALIDSVRVDRSLRHSLRRGRWLLRNAGRMYGPPHVATCGMTKDAMIALAVQELRRAIQEEPGAWEPWALLGEEAEARGGGPDVLAEVLAGERPVRARSFVSAELEALEAGRPLDRDAAREAASHFAEAVRRGPPRPRYALYYSELPLDRSTILAHQARAHVGLGEDAAAETAWREALDDAARGSWGYFEAAFMLAERAHARGDRPEARRLYDLARRGHRAYYQSDLIQSGHGPAMLARIERRRAELWDDCRIWGPIRSPTRQGCAPGEGQ
jgi:hypothetical protein